MMKVERFEELEIWQIARELSKNIKVLSTDNSFEKDFRFRDQIRAAAGSIMDNIAEGFERGGNKEFLQFLYIAKGSCGEVRSQNYRALDFGYVTQDQHEQINNQVIQLNVKINNLIQYLKNSNFKGEKYHK
ncbi:MAG: four helix bundle protein [Bacteroidales bacterium]|nr:four helix bundle protein [Bacteroidales bacterium]